MKKTLFAAIIAIATTTVSIAQDNTQALIPYPNKIEQCSKGKTFEVNSATTINSALPGDAFVIKELQRITQKRLGLTPGISSKSSKNIISLQVDSDLAGREHYTLEVNKNGIFIKGATEGAIFLALQTLDQLLIGDICNTAENRIAHVRIDDSPRFGFRAIMLDPARHFIPVKDVKLFIDQMARFKFNTLQLHLTDDQGWRIEIKSTPSSRISAPTAYMAAATKAPTTATTHRRS